MDSFSFLLPDFTYNLSKINCRIVISSQSIKTLFTPIASHLPSLKAECFLGTRRVSDRERLGSKQMRFLVFKVHTSNGTFYLYAMTVLEGSRIQMLYFPLCTVERATHSMDH